MRAVPQRVWPCKSSLCKRQATVNMVHTAERALKGIEGNDLANFFWGRSWCHRLMTHARQIINQATSMFGITAGACRRSGIASVVPTPNCAGRLEAVSTVCGRNP